MLISEKQLLDLKNKAEFYKRENKATMLFYGIPYREFNKIRKEEASIIAQLHSLHPVKIGGL
jgi:hypothetical protein